MSELLDKVAAAALLKCSPDTVEEMARENKLPAVKFGREWIFPRESLMETIIAQSRENLKKRTPPKPKAVSVATLNTRRAPPALPAH